MAPTDTFALTARPANVALAWATRDAIFCEIPCKAGPPYIIRERRTIEGLARVLGIMVEAHEAGPRMIQTSHPAIKKAKPEHGSPEARARAAAIVQKLFR